MDMEKRLEELEKQVNQLQDTFVKFEKNAADNKLAMVVFSGDLGRYGAILAKDPEPAPDTDYLVIESTYGNRRHAELSVLDQLEGALDSQLVVAINLLER